MPLTRRRMLAAAGQATGAFAVLTACRLDQRSPARPAPTATPIPTQIPRPSRPTALLALVAAERDLLAVYDATLARHPALLPRLAALRADHAAHLDALAAAARVHAGTPLPSNPPTNPPANVPVMAGAALAALQAAEAAAAARTGAACLAAPATQAALLGSIAACESAHRLLLQ